MKEIWKQTKKITLPKASATEQQFEFVCINGRAFQVPRGCEVEVPAPVYEVLENARVQLARAKHSADALAMG